MFDIVELTESYELTYLKKSFSKSDRVTLFPMGDIHFDSKYCDRKLLKNHLDYAVENDATIIILGDLFDLMQGRGDKRHQKEDLLPQYLKGSYINRVCEDAAEFFKLYKKHIKFIGEGNHEQSWKKHNESDPLDIFSDKLKSKNTLYGSYSGFMKISMGYVNGTKTSKREYPTKQSLTMYYSHGSGGHAPVTKGTIKANRRQVNIDADIYISGHTHQALYLPSGRLYLSNQGRVLTRVLRHFVVGTYKTGRDSFSERNEFGPAISEGVMLHFYLKGNKLNYSVETF